MSATSFRTTVLLAGLCLLVLPAGGPAAQGSQPPAAAAMPGPADTAHCVDARALDLRRILPPPPSAGSPQERAELDELLRIQAHRTSAQAERARKDAKIDLMAFAAALGRPTGLTDASLPLTGALFRHLQTDEFAILDPAKREFARPRPFSVEPRLHPVISRPRSLSYPSGHSTWAYTTALVLADMVPERRRELLARAAEFAHDRNVAGVHYPSDVDAGRLAGTALAAMLFTCRPFETEEADARTELRRTLGLP